MNFQRFRKLLVDLWPRLLLQYKHRCGCILVTLYLYEKPDVPGLTGQFFRILFFPLGGNCSVTDYTHYSGHCGLCDKQQDTGFTTAADGGCKRGETRKVWRFGGDFSMRSKMWSGGRWRTDQDRTDKTLGGGRGESREAVSPDWFPWFNRTKLYSDCWLLL